MKKLIILVCLLGLSGCAGWDEKSDVEKQAWIFSGAIVIGAIALSQQEDNIVLKQDNCFESECYESP